jgi:hypothetical protein
MLIPIGTSEQAKAKTSRFVKSGLLNLSFSKSFDHGRYAISFSASSTSLLNFAEVSLSTTATKPSNSALAPRGSR